MPKTVCPSTWVRHAGDTGDTIVIEVNEALGPTLDSVSSVQCRLEDANGILADVVLSATVTDSAAREVTVALGTWLQTTAIAGQSWWVSLELTVSASVITFPERPSKRLGLQIV